VPLIKTRLTRPGTRRQLTFPAIPASLPAEFTNLTALENLEIVGGGNSPGTFGAPCPGGVLTRRPVGGPFPATFGDLTALTALHLENTALGPLPDTLHNITSLILVRNTQVGASLPSSISDGALRNLYVARHHRCHCVADDRNF
jgi:hypothetical protein